MQVCCVSRIPLTPLLACTWLAADGNTTTRINPLVIMVDLAYLGLLPVGGKHPNIQFLATPLLRTFRCLFKCIAHRADWLQVWQPTIGQWPHILIVKSNPNSITSICCGFPQQICNLLSTTSATTCRTEALTSRLLCCSQVLVINTSTTDNKLRICWKIYVSM